MAKPKYEPKHELTRTLKFKGALAEFVDGLIEKLEAMEVKDYVYTLTFISAWYLIYTVTVRGLTVATTDPLELFQMVSPLFDYITGPDNRAEWSNPPFNLGVALFSVVVAYKVLQAEPIPAAVTAAAVG